MNPYYKQNDSNGARDIGGKIRKWCEEQDAKTGSHVMGAFSG